MPHSQSRRQATPPEGGGCGSNGQNENTPGAKSVDIDPLSTIEGHPKWKTGQELIDYLDSDPNVFRGEAAPGPQMTMLRGVHKANGQGFHNICVRNNDFGFSEIPPDLQHPRY